MNKIELRKKYLQLRNQLTIDEIEEKSIKIANNIINLSIWQYNNYHIFLSIVEKGEINTEYILHILQGKDKNIAVPKTNVKTNTLSHFLLTDNTLIEKNSWGIPEPVNGIPFSENQIDVVFVPLLAYDKKGNRVGYGKGFYDRFLIACKKETIKIGLSLFAPEPVPIAVTNADIPLDYCITPEEVHRF
ncbi:5-formyltetrahydrofolate cyclo-ligase [uncultured Planktosalinus sp.]|uniref:5-formyltetrahydrofolate cyclo-ligase n=1 Tax=uncultured Planktosalinus sp. TaxID=1810935 RepID=UPI0030DCA784